MSRIKTDETTLWKWLKKSQQHFKSDLHLTRIENIVGQGTPDVEGCLTGVQFWIELKCESQPAKITTMIKPKFRPAQIPWLTRRSEAGGKAFVLLQVAKGPEAKRYLLPISKAQNIKSGQLLSWYSKNSIINERTTPSDLILKASEFT